MLTYRTLPTPLALALTLATFTLFTIGEVPLTVFAQFITLVFALWALSYSIQSTTEQLGTTRFVNIFLIPWLTTLPETISAIQLARAGYPLAGALTFAGSAVFDLGLVLVILGFRHQLTKSLAIAKVVALPLILAFIFSKQNGIFVVHGTWLGVVLIAICIGVTLWASLGEGFFKPQLSRVELVATVITWIASIISFTYMCFTYASFLESMCELLPQSWVGIANAYLTSLPDAIYAGVLREKGEVDEAIGELWSCVIHDYTEVPGFALLFGGTLQLTLPELIYVATVPFIFMLPLWLSKWEIKPGTAIALITLFIAYTIWALYL